MMLEREIPRPGQHLALPTERRADNTQHSVGHEKDGKQGDDELAPGRMGDSRVLPCCYSVSTRRTVGGKLARTFRFCRGGLRRTMHVSLNEPVLSETASCSTPMAITPDASSPDCGVARLVVVM